MNTSETLGPECIVCCCLGTPEDLAVDWFGRNLYWTDSELRIIEISKLDGSERTTFAIIPRHVGAPSLIVVDPLRGYAIQFEVFISVNTMTVISVH